MSLSGRKQVNRKNTMLSGTAEFRAEQLVN